MKAQRQLVYAFTLIEILLSIVVLGVGLLGIGAIFPVIVREQRKSVDRVEGASIAESVASDLRRRLGTQERDLQMWDEWLNLIAFGTRTPDDSDLANPIGNRARFTIGRWDETRINTLDRNDGLLRLPPVDTNVRRYEFAMHDRLYPPRDLNDLYDNERERWTKPRYIWDAAVQPAPYRMRNANTDGFRTIGRDAVRFVVFVRRIDPKISNRDLENWSDPEATAAQLANQTQGLFAIGTDPVYATKNGTGRYGVLRTTFARIDLGDPGLLPEERRERVYIGDEEAFTLLRQAGQKFVDNLGNVYNVVKWSTEDEAADEGEPYLIVTPPLPRTLTTDTEDSFDSILYSPVPPAAVTTFEVTP